jgi:hypothetical protein
MGKTGDVICLHDRAWRQVPIAARGSRKYRRHSMNGQSLMLRMLVDLRTGCWGARAKHTLDSAVLIESTAQRLEGLCLHARS